MTAIHDRYYATPPADYLAFRWRLQLLTEERLGTDTRASAAAEDAAFARAGKMLD